MTKCPQNQVTVPQALPVEVAGSTGSAATVVSVAAVSESGPTPGALCPAMPSSRRVAGVSGDRPVAQLAEQRSPKPQVGGSIPSWPATNTGRQEKAGLTVLSIGITPLTQY